MKSKIIPIAPLFSLVILPGLAAATYGMASLLDIPYVVHILGIISLISLISGTYISIKKINMFPSSVDGEFNVIKTEEGVAYSLDLDTDVEDLPKKRSITFRVQKDVHK